ncbi:AraC family transcriptional regulator [Olivibacter ginsenosidimutans]|uniref:AraC family transcriptional regulator n=1 Tax=Olivibacter ginsenosidimutans TaxID=1176537 RepID=A0ABP9BGX7_9SPHI
MRRIQFESLVVTEWDVEEFPLPKHKHSFYEMIYIVDGAGIHVLNNNRFAYKARDLFIVSPEDRHYFEVEERSRFTFIKFTDDYFAGHKQHRPHALFFSSPEEIMRNNLLKEVKLELDELSNSILSNIIKNIVAYNSRKDIASSPLIYYQLLSIFGLIREAALKIGVRVDKEQAGNEEMASYIHEYIYEPEMLLMKNIAGHFHLAPGYFSAYFKRNFGISYREYVNGYRLKLIEKRLTIPSLTIKEIADEFGFTDISHLSHYFKSIRKISPKQFREKGRKLTTSSIP